MITLAISLLLAAVGPDAPQAGPVPASVKPLPTRRAVLAEADAILIEARKRRATYQPRTGQPTLAQLDAAILEVRKQRAVLVSLRDNIHLTRHMQANTAAINRLSDILKQTYETGLDIERKTG